MVCDGPCADEVALPIVPAPEPELNPEPISPLDQSDSVTDPIPPIDQPDTVTEPISPVSQPDSATEPISPAVEPVSLDQQDIIPSSPVIDTGIVTEPTGVDIEQPVDERFGTSTNPQNDPVVEEVIDDAG